MWNIHNRTRLLSMLFIFVLGYGFLMEIVCTSFIKINKIFIKTVKKKKMSVLSWLSYLRGLRGGWDL